MASMHVTGDASDYRSLAELLTRSGSPLVLAEVHGGLCGVICAGGRDAGTSWLDGLIDDCAADSDTLSELAARFESLGAETWQAFNRVALEFVLLLPDETHDLDQRAEALALWCHGYLAGLVIGGLDLGSGRTELSAEFAELVADLAEISKAGAGAKDLESAESAEAGEAALTELVEYVRVGAQFVFEELAVDDTPAEQRTLH
jgi:hypothetical protein